jgi:hypothetical protein
MTKIFVALIACAFTVSAYASEASAPKASMKTEKPQHKMHKTPIKHHGMKKEKSSAAM